MANQFNIVFVLADQLRASSLPLYGETGISTPNVDRLAEEGVVFTNAVSSCPVCTPYRSMLLTGRYPQTTGHVMNFIRTRHDEIGLGDVFSKAGYSTAWIGKWHLHTGSFPQVEGRDFVPPGRDRLGFDYWRGYNFHMQYFDGYVNRGDWRNEQWEGYETEALNRYAFEFIEDVAEEPFCLFLSPHQPHITGGRFAPGEYYDRLPEEVTLPENVPESLRDESSEMYRHYLAMTLALDDMLGELLDYLQRKGLAQNTLVIFTSDHGTQGGAQGISPWKKKMPYEDSLLVPLIARLPGLLDGGEERDLLFSPVDFLPSLCGLSDIAVPRSVEGRDLSAAWKGEEGAFQREEIFTMNFSAAYDYLEDGEEWRGVRTKDYSFARWRNGDLELFDLREDPMQMNNLAGSPRWAGVQAELSGKLDELMAERNDELIACRGYGDWFDSYRRVVRNVHGKLGDPEDEPDWSLLS